jgi:uncharacterized protein (DUF305 family)
MRYLALLFVTACASSAKPTAAPPASSPRAEAANARYTRADVQFMSGMIGHHAQAIVMARLAPANNASASLRTLAERIAVSQQDEIDFMSAWLRKRTEKIPAINTNLPAEHFHHGPDHVMMPGMLTPAQMDSLSKARGPEFDKLFLTYMIQHHRGAVSMVKTLFASPGAGQEGEIFRFATDVESDQNIEIRRMQSMLDALKRP